ncbi:MAG: ABC transporter substrate-binding protein [Tropicimonas sp.]|uniref:ABC transporter substrate-binding protein n=1 Tax=Tropicimonas sp. TaxID=2067044 RepID=UPI003A89A9E5
MRFATFGKAGMLAALMAGSALSTAAHAAGTVDIAIIGEADTFDPMVSTKDVVSIVTQHFVETLYTFDSGWNIAPLLATDLPVISEDGLSYTIGIREGVTFHDGSTMDAQDVVASLKRWTEIASRGKAVADKIASIEASGDFEVTISMNEPYSPLLSLLAFSNSAAAIYPQEILAETIANVVGTGPYRIGEHVPDQYLQLVKFDGYVSREEPTDGAAGRREQSVDEIRFIPVPDPNTRIEGLLSGQFDFADALPTESYERLQGSDIIAPQLLEAFGWPLWAINHKAGLMTDKTIRLALQAALPIDDMLFAAFGDEKFYAVDGPMYPEGWFWRTDAGTEAYNQNDQAKAGELLKEAGYDGTPLRILTSRQYEFHFKMAEVAKMALEMAGFTVEMDVVDWATLGQRRNDPALWDIYISHSPFLPEPALNPTYFPSYRMGWSNPEKDEILTKLNQETDPDKRMVLFTELQKQVFEDVGFIKVGNFNALRGLRKDLNGVTTSPWPFFWNVTRAQ